MAGEVPPPGARSHATVEDWVDSTARAVGLDADAALAALRERLTTPAPAAETRRRRYAAALHTAGLRLDAVLRLADAEQAELRSRLEAVEAALDENLVWAGEPDGWMVKASAVRTALASRATGTLNDARNSVERGLDLAEQWETLDPHSLMSRRRAAAILREVLA